MAARILTLVAVLVLFPAVVLGKPNGGYLHGIELEIPGDNNVTCATIGLYKNSRIHASGFTKASVKNKGVEVGVMIRLRVYKVTCVNIDVESASSCRRLDSTQAVASNVLPVNASSTKKPFTFSGDNTDATHTDAPSSGTTPTNETTPASEAASTNKTTPTNTTTPTKNETTSTSGNATESGAGNTKRNIEGQGNKDVMKKDQQTDDNQLVMPKHPSSVYDIPESAVYVVMVDVWATNRSSLKKKNISITLNLELVNPHGYLSAIDYPALVFYGLMTAIYGIFGIVWTILMLCSYQDLIRLQFWIGGVIILGLLEKTFFVAEYSTVNQGNDPLGLVLVAEFVSAGKRALARMLLIIVSIGFGTVKPRLGDSLGKVLTAGALYFILAVIDGIVRAKQDTSYATDTPTTVTIALLLLMDSVIFYWIFTSIVATRRALRLRKNYVKLSLYNHFTYTLIFAILAAIGFLIWAFAELNYPKDDCLTDWKEVWLRDCFWHILFVFILAIVMILWRPSSNRVRFLYSRVNDFDDEEEPEQRPNKNFETVKMHPVSKPTSPPPVPTSQAEDDLRWVEENLPTSAVDSTHTCMHISVADEEVMTTKFEMSKMN